jgi:TatD DNase family protein
VRLIDTHAHLDASQFRSDREAVVARAFSEEVGIITVGADLPSSETAVRLAGRYRSVWAAVGIHPHEAKTIDANVLTDLQKLARSDKVVAIGEIGLDYYRDLSPREDQRRAFREQLEMAFELNLPIIVHNREATDDLLKILREKGSVYRGVIHSFLDDQKLAAEFLAVGFHLGIGGPITFPRNRTLRDTVKVIPMAQLLLETDCPYLTPTPHRGERNEPAYVRFVAEKVAEVKDLPTEAVMQRTTDNARRLFGLPD